MSLIEVDFIFFLIFDGSRQWTKSKIELRVENIFKILSSFHRQKLISQFIDLNWIAIKPALLISLLYNPPHRSPYRLSVDQLDSILQFYSTKTTGGLILSSDFNLPNVDSNAY